MTDFGKLFKNYVFQSALGWNCSVRHAVVCRVIAADTTPSPGKGTATVAVNVPEKQFPIFALAGVSAAEQEGRRTGSDRCPGEADCQDRSSQGRRAPTCPACGIGKVPGPARGPRDDAPPSPRRTPNLAPFTTAP
ncbi:TPA: hypothetical protein BOS_16384 [Bos taurus]|nr:TPA: hypothetical protein BOS_16384 [Bos taurus]